MRERKGGKFMVGFKSKKISNPPSLGEQLKASREKLGVGLAEVAKTTNISFKYLAAIEAGNFNQLPGEVYAKNFLKVYLRYLGLNADDFLALYLSEQKIYNKTKNKSVTDFKKPVERISQIHLLVTPKIVRGIIIGLLVLACLVYLGLKLQAIMAPPLLIVSQPTNNLVTNDRFIEVKGQVEPEATLQINGQQVLADQSGGYAETIDLQAGTNIIEITAQNRHGRQTKIYRQVVVMEKEGENN